MYRGKIIFKLLVVASLFTSVLYAQSVSINDSTNAGIKSSNRGKIILSLKGGIKLPETINYPGIKSGIALSVGLGIELGNDFYFKPVISYWNSKTKGRKNEILKFLSYMAEIEYLMASDGFSIAASAGVGGISINNQFSGRPGVLLEFGILYPIDDKFSLYAGGAYYYLLPLELSNSAKSVSSFTISMGLYYNI